MIFYLAGSAGFSTIGSEIGHFVRHSLSRKKQYGAQQVKDRSINVSASDSTDR